jgi:hypothetical protein
MKSLWVIIAAAVVVIAIGVIVFAAPMLSALSLFMGGLTGVGLLARRRSEKGNANRGGLRLVANRHEVPVDLARAS